MHGLKGELQLLYQDMIVVWEEAQIPGSLLKKMPALDCSMDQGLNWFLFDRSPIRSCLITKRINLNSFQKDDRCDNQQLVGAIQDFLKRMGVNRTDFVVRATDPVTVKKEKIDYRILCTVSWKTRPFFGESDLWHEQYRDIISKYEKNKNSFFYKTDMPGAEKKDHAEIDNRDLSPRLPEEFIINPAIPIKSKGLVRTWILGNRKSIQNRKYFLDQTNGQLSFGMLSIQSRLSAIQISYIRDLKSGVEPVAAHRKSLEKNLEVSAVFSLQMQNDGYFCCSTFQIPALVWKQKKRKFIYIPDTIVIDNRNKIQVVKSFRKLQGRFENGDALILLPSNMNKKRATILLKNTGPLDNIVYKSSFRQMIGNRLNKQRHPRALMIDFCHITG